MSLSFCVGIADLPFACKRGGSADDNDYDVDFDDRGPKAICYLQLCKSYQKSPRIPPLPPPRSLSGDTVRVVQCRRKKELVTDCVICDGKTVPLYDANIVGQQDSKTRSRIIR